MKTVSINSEVRCMGGNLKIVTDLTLDKIDVTKFSALAIPGGFCDEGFFDDIYSESFLSLIREFNEAGKPIASICVGAMALGKSGVLINRRGTTYKSESNHRRYELTQFGVTVVDKDIVVDNNIITSNGPSSGIYVALKLLEMLTNKDNSNRIKSMMGY